MQFSRTMSCTKFGLAEKREKAGGLGYGQQSGHRISAIAATMGGGA
jgi:hypothetical protein